MSEFPYPFADLSPAALLNRSCHCVTVDPARLAAAMRLGRDAASLEPLVATHPHLFSNVAVFVDPEHLEAMKRVVEAIERLVSTPAYRERALRHAHPHARIETPARGVFYGYDFHLGANGPALIEINTNAGGAILNAALREAQRACCVEVARWLGLDADEGLFDVFVRTMREEWKLARGDAELRTIAIVDDAPSEQFLAPEFDLFARVLEDRGIGARVVDATALAIEGGRLVANGEPIDLVYNRLVDFTLEEPAHAALATAFVRDLAVVTPHPRAHALYSDKRLLALLSNPSELEALGAAKADVETLIAHVPRTVLVTKEAREALWAERKSLFFKPATGYAGKAAYRGDKITKSAFEALFERPYVAQALVPPSVRTIRVGDEERTLKIDLRDFVYDGRVQLTCARLYQGQTTNFRTEGGGFAPVFATDAGCPREAFPACDPRSCG